MRMGRSEFSAAYLISELDESELSDLFFKFGEERFSKRIARAICVSKKQAPIMTTFELSEIVKNSVPAFSKFKSLKRVFQALRIAVNNELENLENALESSFKVLKRNARMAVISFHSLEDRIVKQKFNFWRQSCSCPRDFPVCTCEKSIQARLINKKVVRSSTIEIKENTRSKSARLRVCERV
jgi:16S rRNA (cytosine1402-N4)-methyltransferase